MSRNSDAVMKNPHPPREHVSVCGLRMDEQQINLQCSGFRLQLCTQSSNGKMINGNVWMSCILVVNPCSKSALLPKNVFNGVTNSSDRNYQLIILQLTMGYTLQACNLSRYGKMIDGDVQI